MRKRLKEILWLIVLVMILSTIGVLLLSGGIRLYIAPRLIPVSVFGFFVLLILSVRQVVMLFHRKALLYAHAPKCYVAVFAIPILLMLLTTPDQNTPQTLPKQNAILKAQTQTTQGVTQATPSVLTTPDSAVSTTPQTTIEPIDIASAQPCKRLSGSCTFNINEDMFESCLYTSVEELCGREITLYGFIYKDSAFPKNTIALTRLYITCCVADASLVGYHIKVEDTDDFMEDMWIRVTGIVEGFSLGRDTYPILTNGTVQECEAPQAADAYIYP